jgi:hypothetical protein
MCVVVDAQFHQKMSLALHAAVAERLAADPAMVQRARARIEAWLPQSASSAPLLLRWRQILERPAEELRQFLTEESEHADWLRKASPFAGELPPRERERIVRDVRRRIGSAG